MRHRRADGALGIGLTLVLGVPGVFPTAAWVTNGEIWTIPGVEVTANPSNPAPTPPERGPVPSIPARPGPPPGASAPTSPPSDTTFVCPKTPYIDCMPAIKGTARPLCSKDYIDWAKAHCPGVAVVY